MILAGDVGGTKTNLGLFESRDGHAALVRQRSFPSQDYPGLGEILGEFLAQETAGIANACFGVAGPVVEDGAFMKAFTGKGRLSTLLSLIPVRVILEEKAALYGAAHWATVRHA